MKTYHDALNETMVMLRGLTDLNSTAVLRSQADYRNLRKRQN